MPVFFHGVRCHFALTASNNASTSSNWRPEGPRESHRVMGETGGSLSALEEAADATVQMSSSVT